MTTQKTNIIAAHSRIDSRSNDKIFTKIITFKTNDELKLPTNIPFQKLIYLHHVHHHHHQHQLILMNHIIHINYQLYLLRAVVVIVMEIQMEMKKILKLMNWVEK